MMAELNKFASLIYAPLGRVSNELGPGDDSNNAGVGVRRKLAEIIP